MRDIEVPTDIIETVKKIEKWAARQTIRDDWAIGGIACRAGFERLMRRVEDLEEELKRLKKRKKKSE